VKHIFSVVRRCGGFVADLFKGPGNHYWDLGRIISGVSVGAMIGAQLWNIHLGKEIDLGPTGLGGGLTAVLGGCAGFLAAKAWERSKHKDSGP
jgi:hypothetical protein